MHLNRSRWIKERKLKASQLAGYSLFCLNGLGTLGSLEELRGCLLHLVVRLSFDLMDDPSLRPLQQREAHKALSLSWTTTKTSLNSV